MSFRARRVSNRFMAKKSKPSFYRASARVVELLKQILEKYAFTTLSDALDVVESPEDMLLLWDEADVREQKDTLNLLEGAEIDARRFLRALDILLEVYESYESLDEYLVQLLDREYPDLFSLVQMHI